MSATTDAKASCHSPGGVAIAEGGSIALVGNPNVGKSVLFKRLTGRYVMVANYPGTTVEMTRGSASEIPGVTIVDTPGVVSIPARSEDESVTTRVLLNEPLKAVVQVGDAKNLRRTLLLTAQIAELGLPMVLALNMLDEAEQAGVSVDFDALSKRTGVHVCPTVATTGRGVDQLIAQLGEPAQPSLRIGYPAVIETAIESCEPLMPPTSLDSRAVALLWLSSDSSTDEWVEQNVEPPVLRELTELRARLIDGVEQPVSTIVQQARLDWVDSVVPDVLTSTTSGSRGLAWLTRMTTHRFLAWPILAAVLYGVYWFVGVFGAGTLVGLIETNLFGETINPWVIERVNNLIPSRLVADFFVGDYGLWTMGMTYALALVLPIVTTFFIVFSMLEDSGYLSRMTVISNRVFRVMGLNGKAVLPMVLGLGCVTMATLTTRILESKRDRLLAILLLALAVPCSAQLGVVLGMLGSLSLAATLIWAGVLVVVLISVGAIASRLIPGERTTLLVEMPPLRMPSVGNVMTKTLTRLEWYLREVIPLFLAGTAALFVLHEVGALPAIIDFGEPLVTGWLGLPAAASAAFMLGFLRRDFGATGLFVMHQNNMLSPEQVVVAMVTITLFIPCVASVLMIARERGARTATAMVALVFPLAFFIGGVVHRVLQVVGWGA